jgi:integrase
MPLTDKTSRRKPLTDTAIRNTKPASKQQRLWDGDGLYLEVSPAGGRLWRFKYRFGGKEKLLALGKWNVVTLKDAREHRNDCRKLLARGIDPGEQRAQEKRAAAGKAANSFEAVAREWYGKQSGVWSESHADDVLRRLEANLFPEIGARPIADIDAPALLAAVRTIEKRGAHDLAHRVLQVSSQVFRYGVATGRCMRDPAPDLRGALAPHKKRNQAAVTPDELPALLRAIDGYDAIGEKLTGHALRLMALTFVRTKELIEAPWSEFDLDNAVWMIPAERMKADAEHVVPLSAQALAILRELQAIGAGSRYVFPGRNPDKPISNNTMLFALYRLGYKGKMTGHGFRAVASTILNEARTKKGARQFDADVIERQLAHCERNAVRGAYNRAEYLPERRAMMQAWADMLDAMRRGAQVIPLQRARG